MILVAAANPELMVQVVIDKRAGRISKIAPGTDVDRKFDPDPADKKLCVKIKAVPAIKPVFPANQVIGLGLAAISMPVKPAGLANDANLRSHVDIEDGAGADKARRTKIRMKAGEFAARPKRAFPSVDGAGHLAVKRRGGA